MKGLLGANLRANWRRYIATGVAVAISTAFVAICLAVTGGMNAAMTSSIKRQYTGVAVKIAPTEEWDPQHSTSLAEIAEAITQLDQVDQVVLPQFALLQLQHGPTRLPRVSYSLNPAGFDQPEVLSGALPSAADEIAIDQAAAEALGLQVGDEVTASGDAAMGQQTTPITLKVSAIIDSGNSNAAYLTTAGMSALKVPVTEQSILVSSTDPQANSYATDQATVQLQTDLAEQLRARIGSSTDIEVLTTYQAVEQDLQYLQLGSAQLTAMLLVFPVIAAAVAIIVVSTTFRVLMARRRRELALLRTLGATGAQVRSLVVRETLVVGAVSALVGALAGAGIGTGVIALTGLAELPAAAQAAFNPLPLAVIWLGGTFITLVSGLRPALAVAAVSPMVALSPVDEAGRGASRSRRLLLGLATAFLVLAGAGVAAGFKVQDGEQLTGFLVLFASGVIGLIAAMGVCTVLLPGLARLLGLILPGTASKLARQNTVRNPGRTGATGVAIAIGVSLMVTMLVGASSIRATLLGEVDTQRPFDLTVSSSGEPLTEKTLAEITAIDGVAAAVPLTSATGTLGGADPSLATPVLITGEPDLNPVAHSAVPVLRDDQAKVGAGTADAQGQMQICADGGECVTLNTEISDDMPAGSVTISAATLNRIADNPQVSQVIVKLSEGADVDRTQAEIHALNEHFQTSGTAAERAMYTKMINTVLTGVLGLLAVAVLVSIVGVANTLSLSVHERTRENGLLRAMGMTRRSVQGMLAAEAVLIALAAALTGVGLGITFGALGTYAMPVNVAKTIIEIPWLQITGVALTAVLAALIASWLPGRRASRTSPVQALAQE